MADGRRHRREHKDMTTVEPEILIGRRAWNKSQQLLNVGGPVLFARNEAVGWYGDSVDENVGAFAMVRTESALTDLVGEVLQIKRGRVAVYVYCVGESDALIEDLAVSRRAFMPLGLLSLDNVTADISVMRNSAQ